MNGPRDPRAYERILVIRFGALGDFVQSLGPMAAIRAYHRAAHITLLTTPPFADFARMSGYFDEVWTDTRRRRELIGSWLLGRRLRRGRFDRVYDLQTSDRSARLWRTMRQPEWNGHVPGCSHPDPNPNRNALHTLDRQAAQLQAAGIEAVDAPDVSWVKPDPSRFKIAGRYVLFAPGGAAHRPAKRWPVDKYASLGRWLLQQSITPVLLGTATEAEALADIARRAVGALDLCGRTTLADIVHLARHAMGAVGNDTGPMHLIAAAGAPALVMFSSESDPALCAPRPGKQGARVVVLRRPQLAALSVSEVQAALPFVLTPVE
jgi:ADP-heptose:LPS heptosyltransferase